MSINCKSPGRTVRPPSSWKPHKAVYLVVFVLTGVAVYQWGRTAAERSRPIKSFTSTATICHEISPGADIAGKPSGATRTDPKKIEQQITSETNLRWAIRRLAAASPDHPEEDPQVKLGRAVEDMRENLRVSAGETAPGQLLIAVTYTDPHPKQAARVVNDLAQFYAEGSRAAWKRATHRTYVEARDASDRAQRAFLEAKAHLDAFFQQHFKQHRSPAEEAANSPEPESGGDRVIGPATSVPPLSPPRSDSPTPTPATPVPQATIAKPPLVENPEWVELDGQLAELRRLLHPEVQDTELRIDALRQQQATTPRWVSAKRSNPLAVLPVPANEPSGRDAPVPKPAEALPGQTAAQHTQTAQTFQTLKRAVDRTNRAYKEASRRERQAWQAQLQEPQIKVELARPCNVPPPASPDLGLLLVALASGLTAVTGLGMISAGATLEPILTSVAQAEALLSAPVLGTISATGPASHLSPASRRQPLLRLVLILAGLILLAGCAWVLLRGLGG